MKVQGEKPLYSALYNDSGVIYPKEIVFFVCNKCGEICPTVKFTIGISNIPKGWKKEPTDDATYVSLLCEECQT